VSGGDPAHRRSLLFCERELLEFMLQHVCSQNNLKAGLQLVCLTKEKALSLRRNSAGGQWKRK
jgi:hypothetical protein